MTDIEGVGTYTLPLIFFVLPFFSYGWYGDMKALYQAVDIFIFSKNNTKDTFNNS